MLYDMTIYDFEALAGALCAAHLDQILDQIFPLNGWLFNTVKNDYEIFYMFSKTLCRCSCSPAKMLDEQRVS